MVLPSDDHVVLRQWLATRGVEANELAGILVTGDLDPLLAVAGSHRRLAPVDRPRRRQPLRLPPAGHRLRRQAPAPAGS